MTIEKVFRLLERMKPNCVDLEQKLQFINEIEGKVQTDVMLLSPADVIVYDENMLTHTLLVRPPHDKLYLAYLVAMTDFALGEYNKYDTTIAVYNDYMDEYKAWYAMTYRPADGAMKALGYYLSAYAIAVAHGYTGTEEQWLTSLVGERGLSDYDIAVRLGYEGSEEEWVASLKGESAYELAVINGYEGTEAEWLESLKGADGTMTFEELTEAQKATLKGEKGDKGDTPEKGVDYFTEADKAEMLASLTGGSDGAKIVTGTYRGTGTYGESNPNTLTFPFAPKFVLIYSCNTAGQAENSPLIFIAEATQGVSETWSSGTYNGREYWTSMPFTITENTISWYCAWSSASNGVPTVQRNSSGIMYAYVAIG